MTQADHIIQRFGKSLPHSGRPPFDLLDTPINRSKALPHTGQSLVKWDGRGYYVIDPLIVLSQKVTKKIGVSRKRALNQQELYLWVLRRMG